MFHHAVMDPGSMARTRELLRLLSGHERVRPARMMELAGSVVV